MRQQAVNQAVNQTGVITEIIKGIVDRVTFHNPDNGWSILRVLPFNNPHGQETVIVHQTKVFAGATMEFEGFWTIHPKYGRQFQATAAREKKPATAAALEKYLGSGLIKGVGPKTAKKIVMHFDRQTLDIFEENIERLTEVPGIAQKKLDMISQAWTEHKSIREVMMFLQSHGISTLFAVRIYKKYGDDAIKIVTQDPYRLANDFYGIGFFSADKVALSIGLEPDSRQRIMAGIKHALAASRNFGHCYLTASQIDEQVTALLQLDLSHKLMELLQDMEKETLLMVRDLVLENGTSERCYYSKSLYFDELYVAKRISDIGNPPKVEKARVERWISVYCEAKDICLSHEQAESVCGVVREKFSILTGGPGCGKTTATLVIVKLIEAMGLNVILAAPTGRAAQRMMDVIGKESKTIHRLLGWQGGKFKKDEKTPLKTDFLIVDECSMLDINLTASLLKAVPETAQVLFIGDSDQLPSVGAGNVLKDIISSGKVPCFKLTKIFRQAQSSLIIKYAHQINKGKMPWIKSPFKSPGIWQDTSDCLFLDSEEATKEQVNFIARVKHFYGLTPPELENNLSDLSNQSNLSGESADADLFEFRVQEPVIPYETEITIPKKFEHVDLQKVYAAQTRSEELLMVVKKVHPWSSLHYGICAVDVVKKLYQEWIPKYYGNCEIQILSPMTRGSLGTVSLNKLIQETSNPYAEGKRQLKVGERIFRAGDRVIHRRNNYDLGVFNGDIGVITEIDNVDLTCTVSFYPDNRQVHYRQNDIMELDLAYAITIHKSQGSEFEIVIIPIVTQHFKMLFRNLIYTGITRAKKLAVFVGTRKALSMAVRNHDISQRQTALKQLLILLNQ
ncbi:SF1B family DNA helicase RecD2 [Desulfobacula phenolica]|uniref:Exodeoxyribonuclease V alpha subunit n=1 Tax=Desulfobacula phenolica TaxID=90732 RepID=A0A1H2GL63_9BACT|nr:AAA family ATPase [Desulfobacula phenolica]SDU20274.1 exodeoxyribonuclease V alpha subunit [Desulfobacula phenolica]